MKIATIIWHENLSAEGKAKAIASGEPLTVTVHDDYSDRKGRSVDFDLVADYLEKGDTLGASSLVTVNNICDWELNKEVTTVKIIAENDNFKLKALSLPNPHDSPIVAVDKEIVFNFTVLSGSIQKPTELISFSHGVNTSITEAQRTRLASKGVTITGTLWNDFSISGRCIVSFEENGTHTSFYGNKKDGFVF